MRFNDNICDPKYRKNKRTDSWVEYDEDIPPSALYMPCGWRLPEDPEAPKEKEKHKLKHYRKFHADVLEKVKEVMKKESEFQTIPLKRGQSRGASTGFFSGLFGGAKQVDESG